MDLSTQFLGNWFLQQGKTLRIWNLFMKAQQRATVVPNFKICMNSTSWWKGRQHSKANKSTNLTVSSTKVVCLDISKNGRVCLKKQCKTCANIAASVFNTSLTVIRRLLLPCASSAVVQRYLHVQTNLRRESFPLHLWKLANCCRCCLKTLTLRHHLRALIQ